MKQFRHLAVACCTSAICSTALADINLNGFATIAGGQTTGSDEQLYGYQDFMDFEQDSFVGLQINSDLGNGFDVTAQILSRGEDNWNAEFEWAYVGYQATDNLKFLFGRQRAPYYVYSDYLDVSYAYHWISPPSEVYNLPFSSTNGLGMIYTSQLGAVDSTFQVIYGSSKDKLNMQTGATADTEISNAVNLAWNLNWNWLSVRAGYSRSDLKLFIPETTALAAGWEQAGFNDIAATVSSADDGNTGAFTDIGFTIDHNNLLVVGEYTVITLDGTPLNDKGEAWYLSTGYRFGKFMPHLTFGATESTPVSSDVLAGVPDGVDPGLDALKAGTQMLFASGMSESEYVIAGLRWDFHSSAAFKVEFESNTDKLTDDKASLFRFAVVTVF